MAVYTHLTTDTVQGFLSQYPVGDLLELEAIPDGIENTNYFVQTEEGRYILTLFEKRTLKKDLPFFLNLMEHLALQGLPCSLPIKDKNNIVLQILEGKSACLTSFLEGNAVITPTARHVTRIGAQLAALHLAANDFPYSRENDMSLSMWEKITSTTAEKANSIAPGLKNLLQDEITFLKRNWPSKLPTGTIHADLFTDNVLFTGDTITGLIDFYFSCTDFLAYDIAICINVWCFDAHHVFQPEHARCLFKAYDAIRPLTEEEIEAVPLLCRGAALRFLLTRVYDYLHPTADALVRPKDPADYIKRLTFHQTIKDISDYGF